MHRTGDVVYNIEVGDEWQFDQGDGRAIGFIGLGTDIESATVHGSGEAVCGGEIGKAEGGHVSPAGGTFDDVGEGGGQLSEGGGEGFTHFFGDCSVGGGPLHSNKIGEGGDLLLTISDEGAKLRQGVEGGTENNAGGGVFATGETFTDGNT